jgi:hypothetical protein
MTSEKNCIEKINFLQVDARYSDKNKVNFIIGGNKYIMDKKDGSMTKERY